MSDAAAGLLVLLTTFGFMFFIFAYIIFVYALVFGIIILALAGLAFWIFMLMDLLQREEADFPEQKPNEKNNWMVIMFVAFACGMSWLGALMYYLKVKRPISQREALDQQRSN